MTTYDERLYTEQFLYSHANTIVEMGSGLDVAAMNGDVKGFFSLLERSNKPISPERMLWLYKLAAVHGNKSLVLEMLNSAKQGKLLELERLDYGWLLYRCISDQIVTFVYGIDKLKAAVSTLGMSLIDKIFSNRLSNESIDMLVESGVSGKTIYMCGIINKNHMLYFHFGTRFCCWDTLYKILTSETFTNEIKQSVVNHFVISSTNDNIMGEIDKHSLIVIEKILKKDQRNYDSESVEYILQKISEKL
jgi:hypothetical protein